MSQKTYSELTVDLAVIPEGWWLYGLFHNHTPILRFAGEDHVPFSKSGHGDDWSCKLEHVQGGRLTEGTGDTPARALADACREVQQGFEDKRWAPLRGQT